MDKSEVNKQEIELKTRTRNLENKEEALKKLKSSFERKKHTDVDKELSDTTNAICSLFGHHIKILIN